jgi:hypothetical protein
LLWSPAYAGGALASLAESSPVRWNVRERAALHALSFVLFASVVVFLVLLCRRLESDDRGIAAVVSAVVLGSPLLVYGTSDYSMSHLPSAFAAALLIASALTLACSGTMAVGLLVGAALGLSTVIRWQDALLGILIIPALVSLPRWRARFSVLSGVAAGWFLVVSVQLHAWHLERGNWLLVPQGSGYVRWFEPAIVHALFSGRSGLLTWSPVFGLAIVGLLLPWRLNVARSWAWCSLLALAAELYLSAAAADWWGGHAYGLRRMASTVPLLPLGLLNLRRHLGRALAPLLILCSLFGLACAHLYSSGVEDLSLLFGSPSAGTEGAQLADLASDTATARQNASHWGLPQLTDYFNPGHPAAGGVVFTVAILAVLGSLVVVAAIRVPARRSIALGCAGALGLAVYGHARLGSGAAPDPEERSRYQGVVDSWIAPPRQYDRELVERAAVQPMPPGRSESYRYLEAFLEYRGGDPARAGSLLRALSGRGDPSAAHALDRAATIASGRQIVRWIPAEVFRPSRGHPQLLVPLAARDEPVTDVTLTIDPGSSEESATFDLLSVALPDSPIKVRWDKPSRIELAVAGATAEGGVSWRPGGVLHLRLLIDRDHSVVTVSLGDDPAIRLKLPLSGQAPAPDGILLGRVREAGSSAAVFRGATYADLVVVAGKSARPASMIWQNPSP